MGRVSKRRRPSPDAYLRNALKPITMEREATLGKTGTTKGRKEAELDTRGYVQLSRSVVRFSPVMPVSCTKHIIFQGPSLRYCLGSDAEGKKPLEKPPENPSENQLDISYTGKSPIIGSSDMS